MNKEDHNIEVRVHAAQAAILDVLGRMPPIKADKLAVFIGEDKDVTHRALNRLRIRKEVCRFGNGFYTPATRPIPGAVPQGDDEWENPPLTPGQITNKANRARKKAKPQRPTKEQLNEAARRHRQTIEAGDPLPPTPRRGGKEIRRVQRRTSETRAEHIKRLEDLDRMTGNTQEDPPVTPEQEKKILEETREYTKKMALPEIRIEPLEDSALKLLVLREIAVGLSKSGKQEASAQMIDLADWINSVDEAVCHYQEAQP